MTKRPRTAVESAKMSGKWERSTFWAGDLDALVADGVVVEGDVRLPGDESIPAPAADERVCFQAFFHRGFALPLHPFVRGLLYSYRLQLHDLTPNGILHIACFITLCEAFLGIYPHWGLWRRLFNVKRTNCEYAVGRVGISIGDKHSYFDLEKIDSVSGWRRGWFYLKDRFIVGQQFGLASFNPGTRVVRQPSWSHSLTEVESSELTPFLERISVLKDNLTGGQLISVFVGRRVQPLQHRTRPMWQYEGLGDSTRCSPEELEPDALLARIQHVTKCSSISEMRLVLPYASDHPPPPVGAHVPSFVWTST